MVERVQIGSATLYRGDCRDVLALIQPVDVVISDPVWPNCPEGLLQGSDDPEGLLRACLKLVTARRLVLVVRSHSDPRSSSLYRIAGRSSVLKFFPM